MEALKLLKLGHLSTTKTTTKEGEGLWIENKPMPNSSGRARRSSDATVAAS